MLRARAAYARDINIKLRSYEMSDNIEVVTQTARFHEVTYNGKNLSAAKAKQLDIATLDSNRAVCLSHPL